MAIFNASPSTHPETNELSPQDTIIQFLKRNAALILGVGLFVSFWMLVYTFAVYKPGYAAKSMVIIKDSAITSRYIEPDQYYALQTTSSSSSNPVLNTMGILKSDAIRNALWEFFQKKHPEQLKKNKIETQQDWNAFFQDGSAFIKAKNQPGTDLISVQFSWSDPVIAKEGLGVVLSAFQKASRDLNRSEQSTRTQFLDKQVGEIEDQLATIRGRKSAYQTDNRTVSVRKEGDDLAGSRMDLGNKLSQLEAQAQGKEKLVRRYQQLLGMTPEKALKASALGQNASITRLQDELYRLQQQYSLLNSSLTETNPKVKEIESQIEQVKANLEAEETRTMGVNSAGNDQAVVADSTRGDLVRSMLTAHGEAQDLRAQAAVTRNRLGQINTDISGFPRKAEGLAQIEQKEASLSVALDHLREKALEGRLKEEQTLSNVFIVDAPSLPEKAQFPTQTHLVVLSLLMGLGVGVASALAKEQLIGRTGYNLPQWLEPLDENGNADDNHQSVNGQRPKNGNGRPVEPTALPAASNVIVQAPRVTVMTGDPVSDKVELPVVGSLFDSLVPVAGPMLRQQAQKQEIRRDLTRPLPKQTMQSPEVTHPITQPIPPEKTPSELSGPAILRPDFEIRESHLLPPDEGIAVYPAPAQSVRMAPTPSPITVAQAQASHRENTALPMMVDTEGVPVFHAAPTVTPAETPEFLDSFQDDEPMTERADLDSERPIAYEAISFKAPSQVNVIAETPVSQPVVAPEENPATVLYEEQARQMPLPRKMRRMPAFLMGDGDNVEPSEGQPYTLVSRKKLLSASDDLAQDMAPLEAPGPQAQASENLPFPEKMTGETFRPRKPLMSSFRFGKKPSRHPQAYFGISDRKQKQAKMPTSINRLMAAIQDRPSSGRDA